MISQIPELGKAIRPLFADLDTISSYGLTVVVTYASQLAITTQN